MARMTADQLLEAFEKMIVLELSEFKKKIEDRFGVTAAAPVQWPARWRPGRRRREAAPAAEEQTEFTACSPSRPEQDPRDQGRARATGLGLKEAKDLVDARQGREGRIARDEAKKIKAALEEQGAKVEIE